MFLIDPVIYIIDTLRRRLRVKAAELLFQLLPVEFGSCAKSLQFAHRHITGQGRETAIGAGQGAFRVNELHRFQQGST